MSPSTQIRKLQILLHDSCKSEEQVREVTRIAQEEGMQVSGKGAATLSVRMSDSDFKKLFSATAGDRPLAVPECLKPFVASISEAPNHLSF